MNEFGSKDPTSDVVVDVTTNLGFAQELRYEVLLGEPVRLRVDGLQSGQKVRFTAESANGYSRWKKVFRSTALFIADESGSVSLTRQAPESAVWQGVDPAGLFWSLKSIGELAEAQRPTDEVTISIDIDDDQTVDHTANVVLMRGIENLEESPLGDPFPGAFIMREPSKNPLPTIILLGGSAGHDWSIRRTAPLLASRGFGVVGVPYFSPNMFGGGPPVFPDLPRDFHEVSIDRLTKIIDAVNKHPELDSDRLAIYGTSKGAEMALAAAERLPVFDAVVAVTPSDVIYEGFKGLGREARPSGGSSFTWKGQPLPYVPMTTLSKAIKKHKLQGPTRMAKAIRKAIVDEPNVFAKSRIAVERIQCPIFLVGGGSDEVSDCGYAARRIKESRDQVGNLKTMLFFSEKATHSVGGTAYEPSQAADAKLKSKAFPALIEFLRDNVLMSR